MSLCKILQWFDSELDNLVENFREKYNECICSDFTLETISIKLYSNKELLAIFLRSTYGDK